MIRISNIAQFLNCFRLPTICLLGAMTMYTCLYAQEMPPRPIKIRVVPVGALQFGAFTQGPLGGNVIISAQGSRSSTGDIILLNQGYSYSYAILQVQALKGTVVSIATGLTGTLTGGSPSGSMSIQVGGTYPPSPFVVTTDPPLWMDIQVGGTLVVGTPGANPPGSYSGTFNVTFIQE